jgi:hypothetical protein
MITLDQLKSVRYNIVRLVVIGALLVLASASVPENLTRINSSVASVIDGTVLDA